MFKLNFGAKIRMAHSVALSTISYHLSDERTSYYYSSPFLDPQGPRIIGICAVEVTYSCPIFDYFFF